MSDKIYFSLGPVQGFVAQSRRTRDLWSGSFLLSYLAGNAIAAIRMCDGGDIIVPDVRADSLLTWIEDGSKRIGETPRIGSLPNRFEATADKPIDAANAAASAVNKAWEDIAKAVWDKYLVGFEGNRKETKEIWTRQVRNFWEISWTIGPPSSMNYRKNWRTHQPPVEGGDHCTMMGDWQEISGYIRSKNPGEREKQDEFWSGLQSKAGNLNLRDGERLCSMALIKRLFPNPDISKKAIGWEVKAENWPSTLYVAAIPWLEKAAKIDPDASNYGRAVSDVAPAAKRWGISKKIKSLKDLDATQFLNLDGNFYFEKTLADCWRTPLKNTQKYLDKCEVEPDRETLKNYLKALFKKVGNKPASFYALLLMDGDSMGEMILKKGGESVSRALAAFNRKVEMSVEMHNGVTIYAGGDDVLAILPRPGALRCALKLSREFETAFEKELPGSNGRISASLVFSHFQVPLRSVFQEAHHMLDDVAKDHNGRGSIAVSVLKNSGKYCQWSTTWEGLALGEEDTRIDSIVSGNDEDGEKIFSNNFFFNMRGTFSIFSKDPIWKPGDFAELIEGLDPISLLTADYLRSSDQDVSREEAKKRVESLIAISHRSFRDDNGISRVDNKYISSDGAMLVKFLSQTAGGEE